jgi:hypothetical protein
MARYKSRRTTGGRAEAKAKANVQVQALRQSEMSKAKHARNVEINRVREEQEAQKEGGWMKWAGGALAIVGAAALIYMTGGLAAGGLSAWMGTYLGGTAAGAAVVGGVGAGLGTWGGQSAGYRMAKGDRGYTRDMIAEGQHKQKKENLYGSTFEVGEMYNPLDTLSDAGEQWTSDWDRAFRRNKWMAPLTAGMSRFFAGTAEGFTAASQA